MKLAVLMPCMDTVKTYTAFDLVDLFDYMHRCPTWLGGDTVDEKYLIDPRLILHQSSILPLSRCILVNKAIEAKADWVMFLDSDMRFPCDLVHRLLAHKLDVVACEYSKKTGGSVPVIKYEAPRDLLEGVMQVQSVATGCLLIKTSVFSKLRKPWFAFVSSADPMEAGEPDSMCLGEDVYFSRMCNLAGVPMYVDFETSKHIGHVGQVNFTLGGVKFGGDT